MLIHIDTYILVIVLDSICVQNFHYMTVAWVKRALFFGFDISSSVHIDNKKKDILILANKSSVKNENISNKELAEELLKPIIRK